MGLAKTFLVPGLGVSAIATSVYRTVLQIVVAFVVSLDEAVATDA